ncbi:hypothetical protein Ancab_009274 [Ancistrocladus abbreviatus]
MLNQVVHAIKAPVTAGSSKVHDILKQVLDHAKTTGLVDQFCFCLEISGTSLISGSSNLLHAASEVCRASWLLVDALENFALNRNACTFPLDSFHCHLLAQLDIKDHDHGPFIGTGSDEIVEAVSKAFLKSKPMQIAIYYCLRQRVETVVSAGIQLLLRCCAYNGTIPIVLCGLPNSLPVTTVVSGGGDHTLVSEIFSILSLCTSSLNVDPETGEANSKGKLSHPQILISQSCLLLATIAQSFKSAGRNSAFFILTTSSKKQQSRILSLAHYFSSVNDMKTSFQPHCASAMLAFASILALENGASVESSIIEIAMPLIPRTATLFDHLKMSSKDECERGFTRANCTLSYWHGLKDGCVGLLESRLKYGGPLAIQQACAGGIPQLLFNMLGNNLPDVSAPATDVKNGCIGLSPTGVVWAISSISHCLPGGALTFRQILLRNEHVKLICDLVSDAHLRFIRSRVGPGPGMNGVRDITNAVIDLLAFPFVAVQNAPGLPSTSASVSSGSLLNMGSPGGRVTKEDTDTMKGIEENMGKYIKILLEVGVPVVILRCVDNLESKDTARAVAFLAKMTGHKPLAIQLVGKGLLEPARVRRLLDGSCPREVILDVLMIISDLARMDKVFYECIHKANILPLLKEFLTHDDPNVRAKACSAIGNMCRHSCYFYELLAAQNIITLLIDRCADSDKRTRKFACFAIGNAAYHNDLLYEELRRSIPQLANLLLSPEEDKTKANAAGALSNLVRNSSRLCEDIVSKGAMQALLKVVSEYSMVALNPTRKDSISESPLKIVLFALAKMCAHSPCRQLLRSSELFPVIVRLRQSSESAIVNYASVIYDKVSGA